MQMMKLTNDGNDYINLPGRRTFGSGLSVCCKYWAKVLKFSSLISMVKLGLQQINQKNSSQFRLKLFDINKKWNHKSLIKSVSSRILRFWTNNQKSDRKSCKMYVIGRCCCFNNCVFIDTVRSYSAWSIQISVRPSWT